MSRTRALRTLGVDDAWLAGSEAPRMTQIAADTDWPESDRPEAWESASGAPKEQLGDVLDLTQSPWRGAIKAAGRHSARVRFLRRAIVVVCVLAVGVVAVLAAFDPFRRLPRNISIGQVR